MRERFGLRSVSVGLDGKTGLGWRLFWFSFLQDWRHCCCLAGTLFFSSIFAQIGGECGTLRSRCERSAITSRQAYHLVYPQNPSNKPAKDGNGSRHGTPSFGSPDTHSLRGQITPGAFLDQLHLEDATAFGAGKDEEVVRTPTGENRRSPRKGKGSLQMRISRLAIPVSSSC